jgi:lipoprotein-anchoring transpeptidase ErfK/SrfK
MNRSIPQRSIVALALSLVLVLGSVPAYGVTGLAVDSDPTVPSNALIGGRPLVGLTDVEARAAIATGSVVPTLAPITVKGDGHSMTFAPKDALLVNVDAMLQQAYAATDTVTPFELTPVYSVKASVVTTWTIKLAAKIDTKMKNAKRTRKGNALVVSKEVTGHTVYKSLTATKIKAVIASELASSGLTPPVVSATLKTIKPKVTRKNIGKAILVVLSHYSVKLYNGTKVEKSYKCAIGMRGFSTPTGVWKVTGKKKNPSWHNPGSAWAKGMPSVIGPGPSNPLGTRAIYLSAPGIRFHGTAKWWSIGHAASHGCMRMKRHDVEDFYPRVPVGIKVWIVK